MAGETERQEHQVELQRVSIASARGCNYKAASLTGGYETGEILVAVGIQHRLVILVGVFWVFFCLFSASDRRKWG